MKEPFQVTTNPAMLVVCSSSGGANGESGCENSDATSSGSPVRCAGCGLDISDRYYLQAVDRQWHVHCLTCCQCKVQLDSERTCFAKDGHIFCKEDYYRIFSAKQCTRCHLSISPSELVMRAREHVYHLHCFTCATCNKPLTKGEYFGLREDIIYCRNHYEMLLQYDRPPDPYVGPCLKELKDENKVSKGDSQSCRGLCDFSHSPSLQQCALELSVFQQNGAHHHVQQRTPGLPTKTGQKGRPKKHKNFFATSLLAPLRAASLNGVDDLCSLPGSQSSPLHQHQSPGIGIGTAGSDSSTSSEQQTMMTRPKRIRTSFKHHQLRAMKTYFAINHNPDAKDLKQLSQKTGLSKRVLQVWFQNARAKWRRNLLRQRSQGPEIALDSKPLSELTAQARFCDALRLGQALVDVQPTPITQEEQNIQTFTNLL